MTLDDSTCYMKDGFLHYVLEKERCARTSEEVKTVRKLSDNKERQTYYTRIMELEKAINI